jgi:hypothetical protein
MCFSSFSGKFQSSTLLAMQWTFMIWCMDSCASLTWWNSVSGLLLVCELWFVVFDCHAIYIYIYSLNNYVVNLCNSGDFKLFFLIKWLLSTW